jgi:hypothetical protein
VTQKVAMSLTEHQTRGLFDRYNIVSAADLSDAVKKLVQRQSGA